jgi:hypothetical protein
LQNVLVLVVIEWNKFDVLTNVSNASQPLKTPPENRETGRPGFQRSPFRHLLVFLGPLTTRPLVPADSRLSKPGVSGC